MKTSARQTVAAADGDGRLLVCVTPARLPRPTEVDRLETGDTKVDVIDFKIYPTQRERSYHQLKFAAEWKKGSFRGLCLTVSPSVLKPAR